MKFKPQPHDGFAVSANVGQAYHTATIEYAGIRRIHVAFGIFSKLRAWAGFYFGMKLTRSSRVSLGLKAELFTNY
jgi:hypothetical protein